MHRDGFAGLGGHSATCVPGDFGGHFTGLMAILHPRPRLARGTLSHYIFLSTLK